ncbi:hypothetical protein HDU98_012081, partial [Podochytrium sp. JEL0797]
MDKDKIKVAVRVRPLNERETTAGQGSAWSVAPGGAALSLTAPLEKNGSSASHSYSFDAIYGPTAKTLDIYRGSSRDLIDSCCEGINATIFAYGQTSSGKTFTMSGDRNAPGMISLAINHIFDRIASASDLVYTVKVSYLEIYNEVVNDLLTPENTNLKIHEHMT